MHSSVMNRDILNLFVWFEMGLDYSGFFYFQAAFAVRFTV
ncbi:hypothetical protein GCWU000324_00042 [Kingella oralis ATCC 51147]|jgi:hypothetical protein|uniref:Uncharacterized protein n=1 Tax=Kingella oralis ATCC 51147 TaxID=629741 RepID=C4GEF8_9NEIS|nr:hypothetical protein GCWU000324_00042 [Kingella oralis ATCC 51147]